MRRRQRPCHGIASGVDVRHPVGIAEPSASRPADTIMVIASALLIWPSFCQAGSTKGPRRAGLLLVEGAAGRACARRAVSLICAGWVPQDRVSSSEPAV